MVAIIIAGDIHLERLFGHAVIRLSDHAERMWDIDRAGGTAQVGQAKTWPLFAYTYLFGNCR